MNSKELLQEALRNINTAFEYSADSPHPYPAQVTAQAAQTQTLVAIALQLERIANSLEANRGSGFEDL